MSSNVAATNARYFKTFSVSSVFHAKTRYAIVACAIIQLTPNSSSVNALASPGRLIPRSKSLLGACGSFVEMFMMLAASFEEMRKLETCSRVGARIIGMERFKALSTTRRVLVR